MTDVIRNVTAYRRRDVLHSPQGHSELTCSIASPTPVIVDPTEVAASRNGRGIGRRRPGAFLTEARAEAFRIVPLGPFVSAQRRRHPERADLFDA